MLRRAGQWQGNRSPDNQTANKLVDAGGSWFEDVGSTPTASMFSHALEAKEFYTGKWGGDDGRPLIYFKGLRRTSFSNGKLGQWLKKSRVK